MVIKKDQENTDLDKSLYISMEKLANFEEFEDQNKKKKFSFIILGSCGGRLDHTFSTYHYVYKYLSLYPDQLSDTEIFMISKSSMSIFLKNGVNIIDSSEILQNKIFGYSIIPINGEANLMIFDNYEKSNESKSKIAI